MGIKRKVKKLIKRCIKAADSTVFHNALSKRYTRYKMIHGESIYNFRAKYHGVMDNGKVVKVLAEKEYSVNDIFLAQYYGGDYSNYKHMDAAVRILALEAFYHKNETGFDLYRRMQAPSGFDWSDRYKELILSYEKRGYQENSQIELSKDLDIRDGSHRLTLALYHNQEFINGKVLNIIRNRNFDYDFFWKNRFTAEECRLIRDKCDEILESVNYDFFGVIWPPAMPFAEKIVNEMKAYMPEQIRVYDESDYILEKGDFQHLFKGLYHTDILDDDGMELKLLQIENCMPGNCNEWPIRIFKLHIDNPQIGINVKNYTTQSKMVMRVKKAFRERYAVQIPNYQYDVIMHIADNYLQSKFCRILFEINRDISEFFNLIGNYEYVVLRAKNSRQHPVFPRKFYFRGNTDILTKYPCPVCDIAHHFALTHFDNEWVRVEKKEGNAQKKVIIWLRDFMVFQFEFMDSIYGLDDKFAQECLNNVISDSGYKYLSDSDEIIIRILEYYHKPGKKWYEKYIREHIELLDEKRLYEHLNTELISRKKIERFIENMRRLAE